MNTLEVEESEGGSPAALGAANRATFAKVHSKTCRCAWELRIECGFVIECARCAAPIYIRRTA